MLLRPLSKKLGSLRDAFLPSPSPLVGAFRAGLDSVPGRPGDGVCAIWAGWGLDFQGRMREHLGGDLDVVRGFAGRRRRMGERREITGEEAGWRVLFRGLFSGV